MTKFYRLEHYHVVNGSTLSVDIGTFSSYALAESIIDRLIDKQGFNMYPRSCFIITEVILGTTYWENGFVKLNGKDVEI